MAFGNLYREVDYTKVLFDKSISNLHLGKVNFQFIGAGRSQKKGSFYSTERVVMPKDTANFRCVIEYTHVNGGDCLY